MTPDRWQVVKDILTDALAADPSERAAILSDRCAGDEQLRGEVASLLERAESSTGFGTPTPDLLDQLLASGGAAPPTARPGAGTRLGAYRLSGVLGEGGMGVVYLAEQESPRREVALKIIRPESVSPAALRRFVYEAAMLARLQHPGIAQIYEAGVSSLNGEGARVPFFAMERVQGRTLTEWAAERKLPVRERLNLFLRVCAAVQHAHQKGVVHRDLKPANIIVDDSGQPKVLDFGIARALDADASAVSMHTQAGQLVGTVPYMSPEQLRGEVDAIDTRADVYALGVILYELLTGRLPHEVTGKPLVEALRLIAEHEPAPVSQHNRALRGDLQTIVSKAIAPERGRRYQSVSDFAGDVRRFLNREPISARRASAGYQARKFAARRPALVGGAATALVLLIAGVVTTLIMALAIRAEAARTNAVNTVFQSMLAAARSDELGREAKIVDGLGHAAEAIGTRFGGQPALEAHARETLGTTLRDLGALDRSEAEFRRAVALRTARYGARHRLTLDARCGLGLTLIDQSKYEEAEAIFDELVRIRRRSPGPGHPGTLNVINNLANVYTFTGRWAQAEPLYREVVDGRARLNGPEHEETVRTLDNLATSIASQGRFAESEQIQLRLVDICRRRFADHPRTVIVLNNLAVLYHLDLGRSADALPLFVETLELSTRIHGPDHPKTLNAMNNLAGVYRAQGDLGPAEELVRASYEARVRTLGTEHSDTLNSRNNLAMLLQARGKLDEAAEMLGETAAAHARLFGAEHTLSLKFSKNYAGVLHDLKRYEDAQREYRRVLEMRTRLHGRPHPETLAALAGLSLVLSDKGETDEALTLAREALDLSREALGAGHPDTLNRTHNYAQVLKAAGRADEAILLYPDLIAAAEKANPGGHWSVGVFHGGYGQCLAAAGRPAEAEPELLRAHEALRASVGDAHQRTRDAARALREFYESAGRSEDAARYAEAGSTSG